MHPDLSDKPGADAVRRKRGARRLAVVAGVYIVAWAIGFFIGDRIGGRLVYGAIGIVIATFVVMFCVVVVASIVGLRKHRRKND